MSLLLDALKRAEQEKSARQAATPANGAPARPKPSPAPVAAHAAAKPSLELQPIAAPERTPEAARAEAQAAAAAMMQAKAQPARSGPSKAAVLWSIAAALLLLVGAGAAYVWYAMQPVRAPAPVAKRPSPAPVNPIAPGMPAGPIQPITQAEITRLPPAPATVAVVEPNPVVEPRAGDGASQPATRAAVDPQQLMADLLKEAGMNAAAPVRFSKSERAAAISPEVRSGFAALNAGDLNVARHSYAAALSVDPANVDALLGLATVEARLGNRDAARAYYRKVLEIDPRNATSLAGLAATADALAPDTLETQLRGEIARASDSPALHFSLGGLYASQARWSEAQAQYFEAYRLDPQSADAAFNLAVSLDHVGQPRLAAQYYQRALEAAGTRAARFDAQAARRRLSELAP